MGVWCGREVAVQPTTPFQIYKNNNNNNSNKFVRFRAPAMRTVVGVLGTWFLGCFSKMFRDRVFW